MPSASQSGSARSRINVQYWLYSRLVHPMKISKTIKKLNDRLVGCIDTLSNELKAELDGIHHVEHSIQFDLFPGSLLVSVEFQSHDYLDKALSSQKRFQKRLHNLLLKQGILLKTPQNNLAFLPPKEKV